MKISVSQTQHKTIRIDIPQCTNTTQENILKVITSLSHLSLEEVIKDLNQRGFHTEQIITDEHWRIQGSEISEITKDSELRTPQYGDGDE